MLQQHQQCCPKRGTDDGMRAPFTCRIHTGTTNKRINTTKIAENPQNSNCSKNSAKQSARHSAAGNAATRNFRAAFPLIFIVDAPESASAVAGVSCVHCGRNGRVGGVEATDAGTIAGKCGCSGPGKKSTKEGKEWRRKV